MAVHGQAHASVSRVFTLVSWIVIVGCLVLARIPAVSPSAANALADDRLNGSSGAESLPISRDSRAASLPEEPAEYDERELDAYYDWRNNLFYRLFDMNEAGIATFMTARRTYRVWTDQFGTPVVITVANPVFYWVDLNGNGEFESDQGEMWSDPYEDGVNGNERPYDVSDLQSPQSAIPLWSDPTTR